MEKSLGNQAVKGVIWSAVERFSVQGIQFVLSLIIARLIAPSEYGLIAMLGIFLAVAQTFIDSGFSSALIQKKDRTDIDFSTVFYFNIVVSLIVYTILFFTAPYISIFYREPVLVNITRWCGINIIISAFAIVQRTQLVILLNFKTMAKASFISVICSGIIGITLAYLHFGVWALVIQALINNILNVILLWYFSKWRPLFLFSWQSFERLFWFGGRILSAELINTTYNNMYSLVIGRQLSSTDLGYYNRASSLAVFPSLNITNIIMRVIYPLQCSIQDKKEEIRSFYLENIKIALYIICPLMIGLAILSKPFVIFFLTEKWIAVSNLLFVLCLANLLYPIQCISAQVIYARGRSDYIIQAELIKKTVGIIILIITLPFGLMALCSGLILYSLVDIIIIQFFLQKEISIGYKDILRAIFPILCIGGIMGGSISMVTYICNSAFLTLVLGGVLGIIIYITLSYILNMKELHFIINRIKYVQNK